MHKMKKYQIINYHHLLSQIDLQKVSKNQRKRLIELDVVLSDIVDKHESDVRKIRARLASGHEEEIKAVSALNARLDTANESEKAVLLEQIGSYENFSVILKELNEEVNKRLMEDSAVDIDRIDADELIEMCASSGVSITLDLFRDLRKSGLIN